jgi:DNA-binding transcriptional regulator LsrR (DeoR family)
LSTALQRQDSRQHAYPVTADSNNSAARVETVAKATAELMHSILRDGDVIGVDCGRTVAHVAPHLSRLPKCDVIQLTGLAGTLTTTGVHLVRRISAITGGTSWPLYAPLAMADARTAGSLADDPQFRKAALSIPRSAAPLSRSAPGAPDASQVYMSLRDADATQLRAPGYPPKPARCYWTRTVTGYTD